MSNAAFISENNQSVGRVEAYGTFEQFRRFVYQDYSFFKVCGSDHGWSLGYFMIDDDSRIKNFERFLLKKCKKNGLSNNQLSKHLQLIQQTLKVSSSKFSLSFLKSREHF